MEIVLQISTTLRVVSNRSPRLIRQQNRLSLKGLRKNAPSNPMLRERWVWNKWTPTNPSKELQTISSFLRTLNESERHVKRKREWNSSQREALFSRSKQWARRDSQCQDKSPLFQSIKLQWDLLLELRKGLTQLLRLIWAARTQLADQLSKASMSQVLLPILTTKWKESESLTSSLYSSLISTLEMKPLKESLSTKGIQPKNFQLSSVKSTVSQTFPLTFSMYRSWWRNLREAGRVARCANQVCAFKDWGRDGLQTIRLIKLWYIYLLKAYN